MECYEARLGPVFPLWKMSKIIAILIAAVVLPVSFPIQASEPIYLKCSGSISTTSLYLDKSERSRTEDHGSVTIGMTIDSNNVRLSGVDALYFLLIPKTEFSICKANEVVEFYSINDEICKLSVEKKMPASSTDFYSGEYNRILDTLIISRKREDFRLYLEHEIKTKIITTGGEFHCKKVKL